MFFNCCRRSCCCHQIGNQEKDCWNKCDCNKHEHKPEKECGRQDNKCGRCEYEKKEHRCCQIDFEKKYSCNNKTDNYYGENKFDREYNQFGGQGYYNEYNNLGYFNTNNGREYEKEDNWQTYKREEKGNTTDCEKNCYNPNWDDDKNCKCEKDKNDKCDNNYKPVKYICIPYDKF